MNLLSPLTILLVCVAATLASAASVQAATPVVPSPDSLVGAEVPPVMPALDAADIDFDALREAWGRRRDFDQRCERTLPARALEAAAKAGDNAHVYALAAGFAAQCPVSERAHVCSMSAAQKLGDGDKAAVHRRWFIGLTDSAMRGGNGQSPQSAYVTISVSEEYAVALRLGLQAERQALVPGPPMVDALTVHPLGGGDPRVLYFNPAWHFARLSATFGPMSPALAGSAPAEASAR